MPGIDKANPLIIRGADLGSDCCLRELLCHRSRDLVEVADCHRDHGLADGIALCLAAS